MRVGVLDSNSNWQLGNSDFWLIQERRTRDFAKLFKSTLLFLRYSLNSLDIPNQYSLDWVLANQVSAVLFYAHKENLPVVVGHDHWLTDSGILRQQLPDTYNAVLRCIPRWFNHHSNTDPCDLTNMMGGLGTNSQISWQYANMLCHVCVCWSDLQGGSRTRVWSWNFWVPSLLFQLECHLSIQIALPTPT